MSCRSCGQGGLEPVLSLGATPLANDYRTPAEHAAPEARFPLDLVFCPRCSLLQITETVPPERLFREYLYLSSFSDTMLRHARDLVARTVAERKLGPQHLAAEIASNDGYLLQYYKAAGIQVLGIEPARNIAKIAEAERGIPTISEFFGEALARALVLEGKRADVLHAHNVLAHVADLNRFVRGMREFLAEDGVAIVEAPYCKDMIDRCEFDTIYHEHLCYFSLHAIDRLVRRHRLAVQDVARVPIHGGSLRVHLMREDAAKPAASVAALLAEERSWGVDSLAPYRGFARSVARLQGQLTELLGRLKAEGKRIAAYGAAAKGSTLLNTTGIGPETLDFVVDRSTHKQGRLMPGTGLPIHSVETLLEKKPDYVLLLAWNLADEILEQQAAYRRLGGKFIIPLPEPRVL